MRETCGYTGSYHFCSPNTVRFISRYRQSNDYCVSGKRVSVADDGTVSDNATTLDLHAIFAYEYRKYQEYLEWHKTNPHITQGTHPELFDAGITHVKNVYLSY